MDNSLIYKARQGDGAAAAELAQNYKQRIKNIARGYFLIGGDLDDLVQEGMIGLFKAINSFDENKSGDFDAFAMMCVNREIIDCIRKNNTYKSKTLNNTVPLDTLDEGALKATSPENIVINREENVRLLHLIDERLSALEKDVVLAFIRGFSYGEIATQNGVSQKSVDNALQRARVKLEKFLQRQ